MGRVGVSVRVSVRGSGKVIVRGSVRISVRGRGRANVRGSVRVSFNVRGKIIRLSVAVKV